MSLNTADPFFGSNGEPFPLLEGLGDYVGEYFSPFFTIILLFLDGQSKNSLPQKAAHPEHHATAARTIRTSVGGPITSMNFVDPKQREEMLKRRSAGNMINRPRDDVFVLSGKILEIFVMFIFSFCNATYIQFIILGRIFDNNRLIEPKKLQSTTLVNKFPMRSA